METAWDRMGRLVLRVTGRRLIGTDGGVYAFGEHTLRLPDGDVEGALHELCHWVVGTPSERRQIDHGLSTDWQHPAFVRMVRREEATWSLALWLWGDPLAQTMVRYMSSESIASGGGGYTWTAAELEQHRREAEQLQKCQAQEILLRSAGVEPLCACGHTLKQHFGTYSCVTRCECKRLRLPPVPILTESARAEVTIALATVLGGNPSPIGSEALRAEVLRQAESVGLPVGEIRSILEQYRREQAAREEAERLEREALERAAAEARERAAREVRMAALIPRKALMLKRANAGLAFDIRRAESEAELNRLEGELIPIPSPVVTSLVPGTSGTTVTAMPSSVTTVRGPKPLPAPPLRGRELSREDVELFITQQRCDDCGMELKAVGAVVLQYRRWLCDDCFSR